jgi:hypothetical protein
MAQQGYKMVAIFRYKEKLATMLKVAENSE